MPTRSQAMKVVTSVGRVSEAVLALVGVGALVLTALGFRREDRVAEERAQRIAADSAIVTKLDAIASDVKKIKAVVLHCEGRPLCD